MPETIIKSSGRTVAVKDVRIQLVSNVRAFPRITPACEVQSVSPPAVAKI